MTCPDNSSFYQRVGSGTRFFLCRLSLKAFWRGAGETFVVFAALDMPSPIFTFSWFRQPTVPLNEAREVYSRYALFPRMSVRTRGHVDTKDCRLMC